MNRPPSERVVPTLTEVLDEHRWQAGNAPLVAEPLEALLAAADNDLPSLVEPVIDLSDLAILGPDSQDETLLAADFERPEASPPDEPVHQSFDPTLEPVLRLALSKALSEAIPDLVDLLVPIMRRQLASDLVHRSDVFETPGGSPR